MTVVRNIALTGAAGAGKTTLAEALLAQAGAITAAGSIERGDTVADFDPLEKRFHHSLSPSLLSFEHNARRFNLIDTPGYPDFLGPTLHCLTAADLIVVVVNAQAGIELMTRELVRHARHLHLPCMLLINKIDTNPDGLAALMAELTRTFGKDCLALDLPTQHAQAVIEVIEQVDGETDFDSVGHAHEALLDQVVEIDDGLMERYLEAGEVDRKALHDAFEHALRDGHLTPVAFTSGRTAAGVPELLHVLTELAPDPAEAGGHPFVDGAGQEFRPAPDAHAPLLAHVFHVEHDPFVGKAALVRVHQGVLKRGASLLLDGGTSVRVNQLFRVHGKHHHDVDAATAGEICGVAKIDELHLGALLHAEHAQDRCRLRALDLPAPLVGLALQPRTHSDEQKLPDVLNRLLDEDPCLQLERDPATRETVLRGLGDFHLKVALERMAARYGVEVDTHPPSVPYRETLTRQAEGHYRHKKQTGGAGQFGEVFMTVAPLARGAGFEFEDVSKGGVIPQQFIPAVEKGVRQALEQGVVAGYPMRDVRVVVTDGKHHTVDSKEIAFVIAGRRAFQDAARKARPIVLEPVVALEVTGPAEAVGSINADLSARRGRIVGSDMRGDGMMRIAADVPLAELDGFQARLNTLTGGAASWTMALRGHEPVPPHVQKTLIEQYRPTDSDD